MLEAFGVRGKGLGHLDFGNEPVNTNNAERGANKFHLGSESCGVPGSGPKGGGQIQGANLFPPHQSCKELG